jgi:AraC family transcriptional regulator
MAELYATGNLAPYVTGYRIASGHLQLVEAVHPPGDCSNPASSSLSIVYVRDPTGFRADVGGGYFNGQRKAGEMVLTSPFIATDIMVHDPHCIRLVAVEADSIRDAIAAVRPDHAEFDFKWLHQRSFCNPLIQSIMDRLWDVAERGDAVSRLYADGTAMMLVAELLRMADMPPVVHRGGLAPWQLRRATEMIAASAGSDVPLATLAAEVSLSPFHFARAFKTSTGMPPHAWQRAQRIDLAKALLETSDRPVTEIAFEVGYESSQALARLFQRSVGVSPSHWRRDHRQ